MKTLIRVVLFLAIFSPSIGLTQPLPQYTDESVDMTFKDEENVSGKIAVGTETLSGNALLWILLDSQTPLTSYIVLQINFPSDSSYIACLSGWVSSRSYDFGGLAFTYDPTKLSTEKFHSLLQCKIYNDPNLLNPPIGWGTLDMKGSWNEKKNTINATGKFIGSFYNKDILSGKVSLQFLPVP